MPEGGGWGAAGAEQSPQEPGTQSGVTRLGRCRVPVEWSGGWGAVRFGLAQPPRVLRTSGRPCGPQAHGSPPGQKGPVKGGRREGQGSSRTGRGLHRGYTEVPPASGRGAAEARRAVGGIRSRGRTPARAQAQVCRESAPVGLPTREHHGRWGPPEGTDFPAAPAPRSRRPHAL